MSTAHDVATVVPGREQVSLNGRVTMRTRVLRAIPITVVIVTIAVGLVIVALGYWQQGGTVLASAAAAGAVFRLVLPTRAAGALAVRSRLFDVTMFLAMAALLGGMALVTVTPHA